MYKKTITRASAISASAAPLNLSFFLPDREKSSHAGRGRACKAFVYISSVSAFFLLLLPPSPGPDEMQESINIRSQGEGNEEEEEKALTVAPSFLPPSSFFPACFGFGMNERKAIFFPGETRRERKKRSSLKFQRCQQSWRRERMVSKGEGRAGLGWGVWM